MKIGVMVNAAEFLEFDQLYFRSTLCNKNFSIILTTTNQNLNLLELLLIFMR